MNSSSHDNLDEYDKLRSLLLDPNERSIRTRIDKAITYTDTTFDGFTEIWYQILSDGGFYTYHEMYYINKKFDPTGYDDFYSYMLANAQSDYNWKVFDGNPPYFRRLERAHRYIKSALCLIGIVINILNIVTFWKMGLKDSFVIILFNISVADLGFIIFTFITDLPGFFTYPAGTDLSVIWGPIGSLFESCVKPGVISTIMVNALLTTLLAFQRCVCVLLPLKFKIMFTFKITVIIISCLWVPFLVNYLPALLYLRIKLEPNFMGGKHPKARPTDVYKNMLLQNDIEIVNTIIINWVCQVLVIISVGIMVGVILKSIKFRQKASHSSSVFAQKTKPASKEEEKGKPNFIKIPPNKGLSGSKEIRVILQVVLISIIFILAHLHFFVTLVMSRIMDSYIFRPKYRAFDNVYQELKGDIYLLNSFVNVFIYLKFNSRYRKHFFKCIQTKSSTD